MTAGRYAIAKNLEQLCDEADGFNDDTHVHVQEHAQRLKDIENAPNRAKEFRASRYYAQRGTYKGYKGKTFETFAPPRILNAAHS